MRQDLIVVEQLPIIKERLQSLSTEIDAKIAAALAMECNDETVKTIKALRAELNNDFKDLERRRKLVKSAIMTPYEQFNAIYSECVSSKYGAADNQLAMRIAEVESAVKAKKTEELTAYFNEYRVSKGIDFVTFERSGVKGTLSASMKSLKAECKEFLDRIAGDLELIDTQEHRPEILVEYRKSLNVSQAITSVSERHKAIEEQKARQAEREAKKAAEAEAVKRVDEAIGTPPVPPLAPPVAAPVPADDPVKTLTFKVTAPLSKLRELKKYLDGGGYKYE